MEELKNVVAERAVLAGLCQYGVAAWVDIPFVTSSHFSGVSNQFIFQCILGCIDSDMEIELTSILSISSELGCDEILQKEEEISYIRSLFSFPVSKANILAYASQLAKIFIIKEFRNSLFIVNNSLDQFTGDEEISKIIADVEDPISAVVNAIYSTGGSGPEKIGKDIDEYIQELIDNPDTVAGIPSGFPEWDKAIGGGLRRKCFDVVGARTGVGKSIFADSVAVNAALKEGIPVLMIDTEMDDVDHKNRILAQISGVETNDIANSTFVRDQQKITSVRAAGAKMKDMPYSYINVSGKDFDYILSMAKQWINKEVGFQDDGRVNDCLIIYDYLKMMTSDDVNESNKEYQVLGYQATKLHNFCVAYDVPCLTFIQLNRDGITKETTDVASGSDRIVWLCTSFSILKDKTQEELSVDMQHGTVPFEKKIVPVKTRHGGGLPPGDYINIKMHGAITTMTAGPTRNNLVNHDRPIQRTGEPAGIANI